MTVVVDTDRIAMADESDELTLDTIFAFGSDIDLTGTVVDLILGTDGFPRD